MASGDTKTEAMLNVLGNGGSGDEFRGCCNTKTQSYILDAIDRINSLTPGGGDDFTGATESTDGVHGLVPAPLAGDQDKFLKGDGTWETVGGGGGDTVYSTVTTSNSNTGGAVYIGNLDATQAEQADPTTTDNHYKYFWALPTDNTAKPLEYDVCILGSVSSAGGERISIGHDSDAFAESIAIGHAAKATSANAVVLGHSASIGRENTVAIGHSAKAGSFGCIGIGWGASASYSNSVALGTSATAASNNSLHILSSGSGYGIQDTNSTSSICIGAYTLISNTPYSIALGEGARATRQGELNIGAVDPNVDTHGYNNTSYRVIGGVHDGQLANDAATVGQINATIDAINAALNTNIPHVGAQS